MDQASQGGQEAPMEGQQQDNQPPPKRHNGMTVLDADEYSQVFIKIYPSNALTNPGLKDMTPTLPITIAMELKAKAISNGVATGVFQKYGAIPVPGRRNHFLMAVEDEAAGYEIVSAVQGRIRCIPDEPKDPQQRFDQFEYDYHVEMYVEEEGYTALPPRTRTIRYLARSCQSASS